MTTIGDRLTADQLAELLSKTLPAEEEHHESSGLHPLVHVETLRSSC